MSVRLRVDAQVELGALLASERRALEAEFAGFRSELADHPRRLFRSWDRFGTIPLLLDAIETLQRHYPEVSDVDS